MFAAALKKADGSCATGLTVWLPVSFSLPLPYTHTHCSQAVSIFNSIKRQTFLPIEGSSREQSLTKGQRAEDGDLLGVGIFNATFVWAIKFQLRARERERGYFWPKNCLREIMASTLNFWPKKSGTFRDAEQTKWQVIMLIGFAFGRGGLKYN